MSELERKDVSGEPVAVSRRARLSGEAIHLRTVAGARKRFPATGYRLPVSVFRATVRT